MPYTTSFTQDFTTGDVPLTVTFTDTSSGDTAPTSWSWNFGDGGTSTLQNPVHTYTVPGTYTVTLQPNSPYPLLTQTDLITATSQITLTAAMNGNEIRVINNGANTVIVIPTDASAPDITTGMYYHISRLNNLVTLSLEVGVTLNQQGPTELPPNSTVRLVKVGPDEWDLMYYGNGSITNVSIDSATNLDVLAYSGDDSEWQNQRRPGVRQVFTAQSTNWPMDGTNQTSWTVAEVVSPGGFFPEPYLPVTTDGSSFTFNKTGDYQLTIYSSATSSNGDGNWPGSPTAMRTTISGMNQVSGSNSGLHYRYSEATTNADLASLFPAGTQLSYWTDVMFVECNAPDTLNFAMAVANPADVGRTFQGSITIIIEQINNRTPS